MKNRLIRWLVIAFTLIASACAGSDSITAPHPAYEVSASAAPQLLINGVPDTAVVGDTIRPHATNAGVYCKTCWFATTDTTVAKRTSGSMQNYGTWSASPGSTVPIVALKAGTTKLFAFVEGSQVTDTVSLVVIATRGAQPPPAGKWNLPAGMTIVCQTGAITASSPHLSNVTGNAKTAGTINLGGPVPCAWNRNGGNGSIGLSSSPTNPDGTANTDPQPSGYRVVFPAGQVNDPAWNMYFDHTGGKGTYYIGWRERQQAFGSYAALKAAMNSKDSKVWAPKGNAGGDLTIMSWLDFTYPVIGLNFQGVDGSNIPDNNQTGKSTTIPITTADKLPGVAAGGGAWDQQEVLITGTGSQSTSSVCFFVNGASAGCAKGVTNMSAWTATENYLSRSVYGGTQAKTLHMDIDEVTVAVK